MKNTMPSSMDITSMKTISRCRQNSWLIIFLLIFAFSNVSAQTDPDDVIFENSFEPIDTGSLVFITERGSVYDQALATIIVRATRAEGSLRGLSVNGLNARSIAQNIDFVDFEVEVELAPGRNEILAVADYGSEIISESIVVRYIELNKINFTSPTDWQTLGPVGGAGGALNQTGVVARPVRITGTLSSEVVNVEINQQEAMFDANSFWFDDFFLREGSNLITATSTDEFGRKTSASMTVYVDQTAPFVTVNNLTDRVTSANLIDITGTVNDAVEGDYNAPLVEVEVLNQATGSTHTAEVSGINFLVTDINLVIGTNPLIIAATDAFDNRREIIANVTRVGVGSNRLTYFSGNNQSGPVNSTLPEPLLVVAFDKNGLPIEGAVINFDFQKGAGSLSLDNLAPTLIDGVNPARNLSIQTDTNGEAEIWLTLGEQSGLASQIVKVSSLELVEDVYFIASTLPGEPVRLLVEDNSETQYAQTNSQPLLALTVQVLDQRSNASVNQRIRFTVVNGDASFDSASAPAGVVIDGGSAIQVVTDKKGQASVRPLIGSSDGFVEVVAQIEVNDNDLIGETNFNIIVKQRTDSVTKFNGVVMDHTGRPLEGVNLSIGRTALTTLTDQDGLFGFEQDVPAGKIDLFVDGRAVQVIQDGETVEFPALHFETTVIQGQDNQLPNVIYLPPIHIDRAVMVGGDQDVTLTVPGFEGFKMVVKAGSATFADGSSEGLLVVNPVLNDKLPMVPPGGAGRFSPTGWTLQPAGTRFDPPIEVHTPNVEGFAPGTSMPVVQWDHDLAQFVPMGLGVVNESGDSLITAPGSGISKAGWYGPIPPPPPENKPKYPKDTGNPPDNDPNDPPDDEDTDESNQNPNEGADPVIIGTGELKSTVTDLKIKSRGFDFEFKRTYRSRFTYNGPLGNNWNHNHNDQLDIRADEVRYAQGDGRMDTFDENLDGTYTSPDSLYLRLLPQTDGTFILRDRYGFKSYFSVTGKLTARVDRMDNRMSYRYDDIGRLIEITDTLGRKIELNYFDSNRIRSVIDFTGREVQYKYDENNDLVEVRSPIVVNTSTGNDFPQGQTIKYTYSSGFSNEELNHNLLTITDAKNQTYLVNTYGETGYETDRILTQQEGEEDQSYEFAYVDLPGGAVDEPATPANQVTITDRAGNIEIHIHNQRGNLLEKRELTNRNVNPLDDDEYITRHKYDINGERTETTYPEGNRVQYLYDSSSIDPLRRGNLLRMTQIAGPRGASQATLEQAIQYEPVFNQIVTSIDPRAFASEFVPPNGGAITADRYKHTYQFDYQESTSLLELAQLIGLPSADLSILLNETDVELNLGDLNGDAITNQLNGHHVVKIKPQAIGFDGTPQNVRSEYQYNGFGQLIATIDPEGNVDQYRYFSEVDPGGSGVTSDSDRLLDIITGGHLRKKVHDAASSPRRGNLPLERISTTLRYNQVGQVTSMTDGRGNTTQIERNTLDLPIKVTAPAPFSYTQELHYDANNNIIRREVQNTDTNGPGLDESVTTLYEYDVLDNPITRQNEVAAGQFITNQLSYDANENIIQIILGEGNQITRTIDERDLVFAATQGAGSASASTTTYSYDGNQNLIRRQDAQDNTGDGDAEVMELTYDGYDRVTEKRDAVGNLTQLTYDPVNNMTSQQRWGPRGGLSPSNNTGVNNVLLAETDFLFDELNRIYQLDRTFEDETGNTVQDGSLTPGDGLVTYQFDYDRSSRLISHIDDNNHQTTYIFDGANRRIKVTDALGNSKSHRYDKNSNLIQIDQVEIDPAGVFATESFQWQIEYDELNRTTQVIDNLNNITQASYDSRHNLISKVDALNNVSSYIYDGQDRLLQSTERLSIDGAGGALDASNPDNPDGLINEWLTYDDNSRITALIDDNNNSTAYSYDELDRLIRKTWPDDTFEQYQYDDDHNMTQLIDPNGSVHDIDYDGINRLIGVDITRAAGVIGTTNLNYQYDGLNRRTRLEDNNDPTIATDDWVLEVGYDSLSNATVQNQNSQLVASVFDGVGNHLNLTYPSGRQVDRDYDALDRVFNITDGSDDSLIASYSYMGKSRVSERNHGNGTSWRMNDGTSMTGYDELKRVTGMQHLDASGELISEFSYGYDAVGNRRFESEKIDSLIPAVSKLFELDSSYRVKRSLTGSSEDLAALSNNAITNANLQSFDTGLNKNYRIDGVGNWHNLIESGTATSNTDYVVNELNQYEQIGADAQVHDADGNLTVVGDRILRYDALDRLVEVEELGSILASFTYDALSRRVSKTNSSGTILYYHDRHEVIEEQDETGQTLRTFVQGRYLDEMIQMQTPQDSYYYHSSVQLSVAAITNEVGAVVERYRYDDFGQTEILNSVGNVLSQSAIRNPFGYTGRRLDTETGYYYYRARYYHPSRGRFLNRDPIGYLAGMNLYAYVGNNPLRWNDPFGFDKEDPQLEKEPWVYCDGMGSCVEVPYQDPAVWAEANDELAKELEPLKDFFTEDIEKIFDDLKNGEIDLDTAAALVLAVCKPCKAGDKLTDLTKKVCSFEGDTSVLTSEGYKPISEVQVGDYVWSKDEDNTGEWIWRPVTDVYSHLHTDGLVLTLVNEDGSTSQITTTAEHPFFTAGHWSRADQLQKGMMLSTPDSQLSVFAINWLDNPLTAYNMTVGQSHTYTVGDEQVWVHNDCNKNQHGGGKNAPHANAEKRKQAEKNYNDARESLDSLKRKPNKKPQDKKDIKKLEKKVKDLKKKKDFTGENHNQKPKGNR